MLPADTHCNNHHRVAGIASIAAKSADRALENVFVAALAVLAASTYAPSRRGPNQEISGSG